MNLSISGGRRDFLKTAAAGTAVIALNPEFGNVIGEPSSEPAARDPGNKWPGKVAINFNKDLVKSDAIDTAVISKMVDQTIELLTGKNDVGEAWKAVFPDTLSLTSKVAVKVVCYNPYKVGLNWQTVKGVTDGLQKMMIGGTKFPASNITIYELTTSPTSNAFNVAGYTAANFPGVNISTDKSKKVKTGDGALNDREYAQALKEADFLINCFNARGHAYGDNDGKFTCGFKSHFGTYTDPSGMHGNPAGSGVSKNIRELTCIGPVFKKHVLSVCGAIFASNEGNGPGGIMGSDDLKPEDFSTYVKTMDSAATVKHPSTIIMTTDPATAEMQAIKILRINKSKAYGPTNLPAYLQSAAGVDKSGFTPTYNIGIIDETKMTIYKMINDVIVSGPVRSLISGSNAVSPMGMSTHPVYGHGSVSINFILLNDHIGKNAFIEIFDAQGSLIRKLVHPVGGIHNQCSWDQKDSRGAKVSKGIYVARLSCGSTRYSSQFSISR
jgi:hypothetical protein